MEPVRHASACWSGNNRLAAIILFFQNILELSRLKRQCSLISRYFRRTTGSSASGSSDPATSLPSPAEKLFQ
jgi:hypothetical protein